MLIGIDKVGSAIEFVDPDGGQPVARLRTPVAPHDLVLSADGRLAYVTLYGDGTYKANPSPGRQILIVDLEAREVVDSISLAPFDSPHGIAFDRAGLLWVTSDPHRAIVALRPETKETVGHVSTGNDGTHWVLTSPVDGRLFCSNKEHCMITVVDPVARKLVKQIAVPHGCEGLAFGSDGTLYAADHRHFEVLVIDGAKLEHRATIALRGNGFEQARQNHHMRLMVSPDGRTLAVAAYHRDQLLLVDLNDPDRQTVIATGRGPMALAFRPDDPNLLYVSEHDQGTVAVVDVAAGGISFSFACGQGIEALQFTSSA